MKTGVIIGVVLFLLVLIVTSRLQKYQIKNISVVLFLLVLIGTYISMSVSYRNEANMLEVKIENQTKENQVRFDNSWKIVKQEAQVDDKYSSVVKDFYVGIMTGRYGANGRQEGGIMNTLQESNPKFNDAMYEHLIQTIQEQRGMFERDQKVLISLAEQYEILLKTFPSSFFLSDKKPIDIKLVTSGATEKAFETGKEDNVDVFDKPKSDTAK